MPVGTGREQWGCSKADRRGQSAGTRSPRWTRSCPRRTSPRRTPRRPSPTRRRCPRCMRCRPAPACCSQGCSGSVDLICHDRPLLAVDLNEWRQRRRVWPDTPDDELPFVSAVLAAYNEEKVITSTLDALRDSSYPTAKFEVIAVNDGSKDRTLEILARRLGPTGRWWTSPIAASPRPSTTASGMLTRARRSS